MTRSNFTTCTDTSKQVDPGTVHLYQAVVLQGFIDATQVLNPNISKKKYNEDRLNRDRARAWFEASTGVTAQDFAEVCENAGLNPDVVRRRYYEVLEKQITIHRVMDEEDFQ